MTDEFQSDLHDAYHTRLGSVGAPAVITERLQFVSEHLRQHPPPVAPGAYLLVVGFADEPFWHRLMGQTRIGRGRDAELSLRRSWISRVHCLVNASGPDWELVDEGSQNGTFVNGARVARHALCQGDVVQLGRISLVFVVVERLEDLTV